MLTHLGLTDEASNVYRAMLAEPSWTIEDLVAHLNVPERVVRRALDQLADLELLDRDSAIDGGRLTVVRPDVGLTYLLVQAENDLRQRQAQLEQTRAAITAIAQESQARRNDAGGTVRHDGVEAVRTRLQELSASAHTEICSFSPGGAHHPDAMAASKPLNQIVLDRGVAIRAIYQEAYRNDADTLAYAQWLTGLGGQQRTVPTLPMQLILVDREIALVPISPAAPRAGATEIRSLGIVAAVIALFEQTWAAATPFGAAAPISEQGLTALERQILHMLGEGATDEMTARRLGVSVRTLRRTIADLTERLHASSRFQAGLNAARAGWL